MVGKWSVKNPLTLQERMLIKKGIDDNLTCAEIAYLLKRGHSTIKREVRRLGEATNYEPEEAQQDFERKQFEGWRRSSETQKRKHAGKKINDHI